MLRVKYKILIFFLIFIIFFNTISVTGLKNERTVVSEIKIYENDKSEDFYFVHITDTHILHKLFDFDESSKNRLNCVLNEIKSFDKKPAFIVITGDLLEWSGFGIAGALNCKTFIDCFYENNNQLYLDSNHTVPIYTTPGNHDYRWGTQLSNYHRYIDKNNAENKDRYIINYENLSLFFLDSGHDYLLNPLGWIRQDGLHVKGSGLNMDDLLWLNNSLLESNSRYEVVLMHHPAIDNCDRFGNMLDVIAKNRLKFLDICEYNDVEIVLTGHTHKDSIFDFEEKSYSNLNYNCSQYPTLYVQTNDCKNDCAYRNITILKKDIWIEPSQSVCN